MSIKVDQNKCIGCGMCVGACPDTFQIGSEGKAEVIGSNVECAKGAAEACPVQAISVE